MEGWMQKRIGDLFDVKAGGDLQEVNYSPYPTAEAQWPIYANSLENKGLYGYTSRPRFSGNAVTITGRGDIGHAEFRLDAFDAIVRLLVLLPVIDYVIIHELCHTLIMKHTVKFETLLNSHCPDYKQAQAWLEKYGNSL